MDRYMTTIYVVIGSLLTVILGSVVVPDSSDAGST